MPKQYTMNVSLTKELDAFVKAKVKSGAYASSSEVVRELLRAAQARDADRKAAVAALNRQIDAGLRSLDHGKSVDGRQAMDRHRRALRAAGEPRAARRKG